MPFETTLMRVPGPGGWTFARVPEEHAPPVTEGWGRTPVTATKARCLRAPQGMDGRTWETSV